MHLPKKVLLINCKKYVILSMFSYNQSWKNMKTAQDRYFECLEVCIEDEQGMSCRQVCAPILNDDPSDHPTVPIINRA